jgi:hypothetical protein
MKQRSFFGSPCRCELHAEGIEFRAQTFLLVFKLLARQIQLSHAKNGLSLALHLT